MRLIVSAASVRCGSVGLKVLCGLPGVKHHVIYFSNLYIRNVQTLCFPPFNPPGILIRC
jgi:hypothetical protein